MIFFLAFCAVLSGACILYVIAPVVQSKPKRSYVAMLIVPLLSLGVYMAFNFIHIQSEQPDYLQATLDKQLKEEQLLRAGIGDKVSGFRPSDIERILKLAGIYTSQERYQETIDLIGLAQKEYPNDNDLALQISTAYFAWGLKNAEQQQKDQALKMLEKARMSAPEGAPFLEDLESFIQIIQAEPQAEIKSVEDEAHE